METGYLDMDLLRFTTAGSVDDSKSTLVEDCSMTASPSSKISSRQWRHRARNEGYHRRLALLTDGLRAEREQGITIDVAYRYFATPKRKFIISDTRDTSNTPKHGDRASTDLAIILVDARKGVIEQTCRRSFIASPCKSSMSF